MKSLTSVLLPALLVLLLSPSNQELSEKNAELIGSGMSDPTSVDSTGKDLPDFMWPTIASRSITSAFGEFRKTHFHLGIDIGTWDRTGYEIYAADDGYVSRLSISPTGLGKMIQVRHRAGFTTLYGHLNGFQTALAAATVTEQKRLGQYPVDLRYGADRFPVQKGELIGYSGETGIGSPHLHFEVRDESNANFNPFQWRALQVSDTIPPMVLAIAVIPLSEQSRVDGRWQQKILPAAPTSRGTYRTEDTVWVIGEMGIAVHARDKSNGTRFEHGVYKTTLRLDGKELQTITLDQMPGRGGQQIMTAYDFELYESQQGKFLRLFVDSGHRLPIYRYPAQGSGILHCDGLSAGLHTVSVACVDFAGNTTTATVVIVKGEPVAALPTTTRTDRRPDSMTIGWERHGDFMKVCVRTPVKPEGEVQASVREGRTRRDLRLIQEKPYEYAGVFRPITSFQGKREITAHVKSAGKLQTASTSFEVFPLLPDRAGTIELDGGNLVVSHKVGATFKPVFCTIDKRRSNGNTTYMLSPSGVPLDEGIEIGLRPSTLGKKMGLFARNGSSWSLLSQKRSSSDGRYWGRLTRNLGELAILTDVSGPQVTNLQISPTGAARPLISFVFEDKPSGVEYNSLKTYIDGVLYIPEIDGENHRATVQFVDPLTRGSHHLMIRLADKLGNVSVVQRQFAVR